MKPLTSMDQDDHRWSTLRASHFETYARGTRAFDNYLHQATGYTDADRAFNEMVRADDYEHVDGSVSPSPGYGPTQFSGPLSPPPQEFRRTLSASLVPPAASARGSSPNMRPPLSPRLSSGQLLHHQGSAKLPRQSTAGLDSRPSQSHRRSSQSTVVPPQSPPTIRRRPSNEHRRSVGDSSMRHPYVESDAESDDSGHFRETEPPADDSSSDD